MRDPAPLVLAEGITLRFGDNVALRGVNLRVDPGEIVLITGDNGSGKSVLMDLVAGRLKPSDGGLRGRSMSVAHLRQDPAYPSESTPRQILRIGAWAFPEWSAVRALEIAADLALPVDREVWRLSRGTRSAIGMVLGLGSRAELMLYDEPFLGVDVPTARTFGTGLRRAASSGAGVVVATVRPDLLRGVADRIVVLTGGSVGRSFAATEEAFNTLEF